MGKKTYVVMGASGQIGHVVLGELLEKGHHVKALIRNPNKIEHLKSKGAEVIVIGNFDNQAQLATAFEGADGVFALLPPSYGEENLERFHERVGTAIKTAIEDSSVPYLVNLSSVGADLTEGTGPIKSLHRQEERLNAVKNLNLLHFRPSYFMENFFWSIPAIRETGRFATPLSPELAIPMVSTDDIGFKVAEFLDQLNFKEETVCEFTGPHEPSPPLKEVTKILGEAIAKPQLECVQQSYDEAKKSMLGSGMKPGTTDLMLEMYRAFNEGKVAFTQRLTPEHRGKTTIEQFSKKFECAYRKFEEQ
ncbi:MAG: NmrA family NAD(P)-binding protein [Chlamydiales bacterium]|nr:NmrA family NAD(P)-binding protein [Chlamydiales bacterium]